MCTQFCEGDGADVGGERGGSVAAAKVGELLAYVLERAAEVAEQGGGEVGWRGRGFEGAGGHGIDGVGLRLGRWAKVSCTYDDSMLIFSWIGRSKGWRCDELLTLCSVAVPRRSVC